MHMQVPLLVEDVYSKPSTEGSADSETDTPPVPTPLLENILPADFYAKVPVFVPPGARDEDMPKAVPLGEVTKRNGDLPADFGPSSAAGGASSDDGAATSDARASCTHLVVLIHGYAGSAYDLRLLCSYMQLELPLAAFLMSQANQQWCAAPRSCALRPAPRTLRPAPCTLRKREAP